MDTGEAAICGPIEFELHVGACPAEVGDIRTDVAFCTMLDFTPACWHRAAQVERILRKKGVTVPRDDIFVVAAAMEHGIQIYAHDAHFGLMQTKGGQQLQLG